MKWTITVSLLVLSLAACASKPERRSNGPTAQVTRPDASSKNQNSNSSPQKIPDTGEHDPCAPIYEHDEKHYTAGGLYAPQLSDSEPASGIDVEKLSEPVPKREPLAKYGNKTPYTVLGKTYKVLDQYGEYDEHGIASWYGQKFNGRKTSSGEVYSICEFTAAHKTLPLPSYVRVTNSKNGKSVVVRVNDRGPFHEGRIIDLSYVAAIRIGLDKTGTAPVRVELVKAGDWPNTTRPALESARHSNTDDEVSLQFGSFADKDNAKRLQDRLQTADIGDIELDKVEIQGRTIWRVLLQSVKNEQLADIFEKIQQLGLPKPNVFAQKL
jgi:rare lipoprotein A